jgi:hypothetical protein
MGKHKRNKKGRDDKVKSYNQIIRNHNELEKKHSEIIDRLPQPLIIPDKQLKAMFNNYKIHLNRYEKEKTDS